mgnify:CR=1 FL=1
MSHLFDIHFVLLEDYLFVVSIYFEGEDLFSYLQELKPEKIKNYLKKIWFEHFYHYCQTLNPTTCEMMTDLLKFEADCQAIQIVYNSLAYDFNQFQEEERKKVIPYFGYLYPEVTDKMIKASSLDMLKEALQ